MTHEVTDSIGIDLPDLPPDSTTRADSIRAMQAIYFAAQLEEVKIFQVADVLVQQFLNEALPIDQNGASQIADYLRDRRFRLTDEQRRSLYSRALGVPGGEPADPRQNREFNDLWVRFLSSVEAFARRIPPDTPPESVPPTQQDMTRAARDLAVNLSLHGYGIGHFAATELQTGIKAVLRLLSMPEILHAFGARDMWRLIDRIASSELGGAPNIVRDRTMAATGAVVIRWIAERVPVLTSETADGILDVHALGGASSPCPTVTPTDRDLVDACRDWLVVAAMT